MFCPNCGNEVIDGVCKQCGCSLNFTLNTSNNIRKQTKNDERKKNKKEGCPRNTEWVEPLIMTLLFYNVGSVFVIISMVKVLKEVIPQIEYYGYCTSVNPDNFLCMILGFAFFIYAFIFLMLLVKTLREKNRGYKKYILEQQNSEIDDLYTDCDEWKCMQCGVTNKVYVGTCGCGEVKPK